MTGAALLLIFALAGCADSRADAKRDAETIDLSQNVTSDRRPQDPVFANFEKHWRQFVSTNPDLSLPVRRPDTAPAVPWEPLTIAECVGSADAKGLVAQVTLTWNEPAGGRVAAPTPAPMRIDVAIHHNGFGRGYFTSALSRPPLERFALPARSPMIDDTEAVVLTGPALFPKLMDVRAEPIVDRDTGRPLLRHTIVIRDLGEGLTYQIRLSHRGEDAWIADRDAVFLTPVCPGAS